MKVGKILALVQKDMKQWLKNPFQIIINIVPLLIILIFVGIFLTKAEILPTGIILKDDDIIALEIKNYLQNAKSGTGQKWFEIENLTEEEVLEQFEKGEILCYIIIPSNITEGFSQNETISLEVMINNINDDVTKNVIQRVRETCNYFNAQITSGELVFRSIVMSFEGIAEKDISFTHYVCGTICALTVLLSSGVNTATTTTYEFERKTSKELIMGGSPFEVVTGKILAGSLQTLVVFSFILLLAFLIFGFKPVGNPFILILLILWGTLTFSSLGFLFASFIRKVIPAAVGILILNILGWWVGGGLVPSEITVGSIKGLATVWPGTYFYRSFTNTILLGWAFTPNLWVDLLITGIFGLCIYVIAVIKFIREVKS
ncbi:MAG: ABC transporter permease [Candidatus Thorarchaeota archaeon]